MNRVSIFYLFILSYDFVFENIVFAKYFDNSVEITIPQGKVIGSHSHINNYRSFLGIPYAFVKQRFEEPAEPLSWNGTLNATHGTIRCMQYFAPLGLPIGQEDCLVLNIFTPLHLDSKPYPVMVFIHGGGFYWGSNFHLVYDPRFLVKKNVTVVTVNYRLGAFGFLCLNHKEAPGNVGLKDQISSLKWIQNNIGYFGGDPNSVTLFGQSVGAASVNYLLSSHSAEGLFHRVIMDSGSILMPLAFSENPIKRVVKVAARLGYNTTDPDELLKVFKNASGEEIVRASYFNPSNNVFAPYVYRPCIEKVITNRRPLITEHPRDLLKKTGLNISMIIGYNDKEGINYAANYDSQGLEMLNKDFTSILPDNLFFNNDADKEMFITNVKSFYFDNSTITINGLIDYFSDILIMYPIIATTELLIERSNRTIYHYYFRYDSLRNLFKLISRLPTTPGANHADELFYLFDPVIYQVLPNIPRDVKIIELLTNLWTSFAKTGQPAATEITWERDEEQLKFLEIGTDVKIINLPNKQRIEFWKKAYNEFGIKES